MSNVVSALQDAHYEGAVTVSEAGLRGMITLRGDLSDEKLSSAVKAAVGLAAPKQGEIKSGANGTVAWMSPDELLVMVDYEKADATVLKLEKALKGTHFLALNVSDARAVFTVSGSGCREVIAKGSPANVSPEALTKGTIRRSRLGQIAAAFWLSGDEEITLVCFRSVAPYAFEFLKTSAAPNSLPEFL